jgi:hypothetical protein
MKPAYTTVLGYAPPGARSEALCTLSQEIGRCCPRLSRFDDVAFVERHREGPDGNRF